MCGDHISLTDKVTCWNLQGGGGNSQVWGGVRDTWANSSGIRKESERNTAAEARAGGEAQRASFAAGEERVVTRRRLSDTAPKPSEGEGEGGGAGS